MQISSSARSLLLGLLIATPLFIATPLSSAVIGTSKPAESITSERIATLPQKDRAAWTSYLNRSQKQMQADRAALAVERTPGAPEPALPKEGFSARTMSLNREAAWYGTAEAHQIADTIVSFQTPAGGWSKNLDMSAGPRLRGQSYAADNLNRHPSENDFDTPKDPHWNYVGTLDNDATNTELHFLALASAASPGAEGEPYRTSFIRGIRYLLAAQFPNGGWPQVWPLEGGYHDAITFNDNAVTESAETLTAVADATSNYAFVPADLRKQAGAAAANAVKCILATQVKVNGKLTVWAQQHDALNLRAGSWKKLRAGCSFLRRKRRRSHLSHGTPESIAGSSRVGQRRRGMAQTSCDSRLRMGRRQGRSEGSPPRSKARRWPNLGAVLQHHNGKNPSSATVTRRFTTTSASSPWNVATDTPGTARPPNRQSMPMKSGAKTTSVTHLTNPASNSPKWLKIQTMSS